VGLRNFFNKPSRPGRLGIEVSPFGLAIAWVFRKEDEAGGECECHYIPGNDLKDNCKALKSYLAHAGFENMPNQLVLHPSLYDIFFVDRPEVSEEELDDAVRWKIKDLVDVPLKSLVIDAFGLPDDAYRGNQKKVYVVSTDRAMLKQLVSVIKASGINVTAISISELAARNIARLHSGESGGSALLRMRNSSGTIDLTDGGELYLTRHIESGITKFETTDELHRQDYMDDMLLEIQRSLDYYESQLGKGSIRHFLVAPTRLDDQIVEGYLQDNLGQKVQLLNVNELFETPSTISGELQGHCFSAIAAACGDC
jgi:MSHA biogenesis protein MshI